MWKPKRTATNEVHTLDVSEGLNSVETPRCPQSIRPTTKFQKDLIVWKPNLRARTTTSLSKFQKDLIVWKLSSPYLCGTMAGWFQKDLIVWKR